MKAAVLWKSGEDLEVRDDVEVRPLGSRDVHMRVAASGVCHTDASIRAGHIEADVPCVLGHEGAGTVLAVGPDVEGIDVGDRAIVTSTTGCLRCPACLRGQTYHCQAGRNAWGPTVDGSPQAFFAEGRNFPGYMGTFAEEIVVPDTSVVTVDANAPLDIISLVGCCIVTGVGAVMNTARVEPGSSVAVFGCGGVGCAAIQGARIAGASEIVGIDLLEGKLEAASRFGATRTMTPAGLDTGSRSSVAAGFDYAFDCVGASTVARRAFDALRPGGTLVLAGVGALDDHLPISPLEFVNSSKTVVGSLGGDANAKSEFARLIGWWKTGQLDLEGMISRRIPIEGINEAFIALERGDVLRSLVEFG